MEKPIVEIKNDNSDVIVVFNGKEVFRKEKSEKTISIARDIYFYHKYKDDTTHRTV